MAPLWIAAALICGAYLLAASPAWAQAETAAPADAATAKVGEFLILLADPAVRKWLEEHRPEAATSAASSEAGAVAGTPVRRLSARITAMEAHLKTVAAAIPGLGTELGRAGSMLQHELNNHGMAAAFALIAGFLAIGAGLEALYSLAVARVRNWLKALTVRDTRDRMMGIAVRLALGAGAVVAFTLGGIGTFLAFHWPPLIREIVLGYLVAFVLVRSAWLALGVVLSPAGALQGPAADDLRMLPVSDERASYLRGRLTAAVAWLAFGWITVALLAALGFTVPAREVIAYGLGLGFVAIALEVIWRQPREPTDDEVPRRLGRRARQWLFTIYTVAVWLLWVAGLMDLFWFAVFAAGLPLAIILSQRATAHLLRPPENGATGESEEVSAEDESGEEAAKEAEAAPSVAVASIERSIRLVLIIGAVAALAHLWDIDLVSLAATDTLAMRLVRGALSAVVIILVAEFLWHVARTVIDTTLARTHAADHGDDEVKARRARLRTLLPILRNILFIALATVTLLMALAALGIRIGPLIAGAGIIGVAIGFGAQTLVKDIISGMFYLFDDAFRVGDYIVSGRYKGTVEGFSLRSVRLRHQRGPVFTVPFGELGAVENLSRDWVIDKQVINVTYDTDLDKVRKVIKQVGKKLLEDPEFAPHIIDPLKMQGVDAFGDYAISIRMKLTTKPGEQFVIRRKAFAMLKQAFEENGITFAFPTVRVAEAGQPREAAAQQLLTRQKQNELAEAGGES